MLPLPQLRTHEEGSGAGEKQAELAFVSHLCFLITLLQHLRALWRDSGVSRVLLVEGGDAERSRSIWIGQEGREVPAVLNISISRAQTDAVRFLVNVFLSSIPSKDSLWRWNKDSLGRNRNPPTSVKQINSCREHWALIFCLRLGPVTCFVGECASIHICWGCRSQALFLLCFASPLPLDLKYLQTSVPLGEHEDKEPQALQAPGLTCQLLS